MPHLIKPIAFKPPRLTGLSERLIESHYENNYGGAIRRLNSIESQLDDIDWSSSPGYLVNGLKREQLIALNSMVLHEVYFDSIGGEDGLGSKAVPPDGEIALAIENSFGSFDAWREQFVTMGKALAGGSGWVILGWSERNRKLENHWAADHCHVSADSMPLIALDMYEHAYHMDYGSDAVAYIEAFMDNLHWGRADRRFSRVAMLSEPKKEGVGKQTPIRPEELKAKLANGDAISILDVCLLDDLEKRHDRLPAAICCQSDQIQQSMQALDKETPVIAYCMYGFQVSAIAAEELRQQGYNVRILAGGISAWRAIGGETESYLS